MSPSPAPQAPVPAVPGPRAAALQKVFTGALSSSLKANSYANFSSCFPTPARYCPTALEGVWKQLNTRLEEECTRDFEKILEERAVVDGLNQWDALMDEARRRKHRAIDAEEPGRPYVPLRWGNDCMLTIRRLHTLSADELYAAHTAPFLQQTSIEFDNKLRATQQNNLHMVDTITAQRAEIEQLLGSLENVVRDIEGSVDAMEGVDGLKKEVWDMEQEVAATR